MSKPPMVRDSIQAVAIIVSIFCGLAVYNGEIYRKCTEAEEPFGTVTIHDSDRPVGDSFTKSEGSPGTRRYCVNGFNDVVSDEVTTAPVDRVRVVGSKSFLNTPTSQSYSPPVRWNIERQEHGSICNDGTWSPSTGRGTCSWHGGVDYEL